MRSLTLGSLPLLKVLAYLSPHAWLTKAQNTTCKSTPNDASWPSISQWNRFNESLTGRLLQPLPPALACHHFGLGSNESCAKIASSWRTFSFHQDDPISTAWNNVNNDSCLPDTFQPCTGLGYPIYVVNATTANHVKFAVDFARENNIRLNVKASGHDYLKRYANA